MMKKRYIPCGLVERVQEGNQEAFEELYYRSRKYVHMLVMRQFDNNEEIAKDITQEVFVKVHRHISKLQNNDLYIAWLKRITIHLCIDYQTKKKVHMLDLGDTLDIDDFEDIDAKGVNKQVEDIELKEIILQAIDGMSSPLRTVGYLRFYEDWKITEIAHELQLPKGTVNSRLHVVRKKLQVELKEKGMYTKGYSATLVMPLLLNRYQKLRNVVRKTTSLTKTAMVATIAGGIFTIGIVINQANNQTTGIMDVQRMEIEVLESKVEDAKIMEVQYTTEWTNQAIDIQVVLSNEAYDTYLINGKETNRITENGVYEIQLIKGTEIIDTREIVIQNIDIASPYGEAIRQGDYFHLTLKDDISGVAVDSIVFYKDGQISYDYQYDVSRQVLIIDVNYTNYCFYVYDKAGNLLQIQK